MDPEAYQYLYINTPGLVLSIITITLNIFVIKFYWKSELNVVPLLYISIASLDILTALGTMHLNVLVLLKNFNGYFIDENGSFDKSADVNLMIVTFFIQISCRCSVFCNLVLAVSRTVMILKPFYQINIKVVKLACVLYAVPWIVLYGLNVHEFYSHYADRSAGGGFLMGTGLAFKIRQTLDKSNALDREIIDVIHLIVGILPDLFAFIIPVIIVTITCVIQVISLRRSSQFQTSSNQRHVTITVLLMSTVFVLCNTPLAAYMATYVVSYVTRDPEMIKAVIGEELEIFVVVITLFATVFPILNAALNPVIIISRSSGMRRKFTDSIQRMLRWIRERLE